MFSDLPDVDAENVLEALTGGVREGKVVSLLANLEGLKNRLALEPDRLPTEEQQRFNRFRNPEDGWAFYSGRRLLRQLLRLWVPEAQLNLEIQPQGKPFCRFPDAPHFNLSHGGGWLLLGFCGPCPIGVDVEDLRRKIPAGPLAERFFSTAEQEAVRGQGKEAFFQIWTRKEARLKAGGEGLARGVSGVCTFSSGWQYIEFQPHRDSLACLAFKGEPRAHRLIRV